MTLKTFIQQLKNRFFAADSRWLDAKANATLTTAIRNGEQGHGGELRLVIERRPLPADMSARDRANRHFSTLGLWNTEDRSGVLIYLNLAAQRLEIVADRGISDVVPQSVWEDLCRQATQQIGRGEPLPALTTLIEAVASLLRQHFGKPNDPHGNELPDSPVIIK
ncbi:MAG: TPM domain-containing protein [Cardiobacteriaceae bacterium]|nr:TPM domain-containing protein [Cardiobacteriaceae bacterium]